MIYGPIRQPNPIGEIPLEGIFVNPRQSIRSKPIMARRRIPPKDPRTGKFLPMYANARRRRAKTAMITRWPNEENPRPRRRRNEENPRPRRRRNEENPRPRRRRNPVDYPPIFANPRPKRRRNPVAYTYLPITNPRTRRRRNPDGEAPTAMQLLSLLAQTGAGFAIPGVVWFAMGETARGKMRGWFTSNQDAKARFVTDLAVTTIMFLLLRKIEATKKIQRNLLIGAALRTAKDGADAVLETTAGSMGEKLRMILSLPTAPTTAVVAQPGTTGQQAGWTVDPLTGQLTPAAQAGMEAGSQMIPPEGATDQGLLPGATQAGADLFGGMMPDQSGMFGMEGVTYPMTTEGMGAFVNRQLVQGKKGKKQSYQGVGSFFVNRNLVFSEQGQRHPIAISGLFQGF